jgi:DNA-binding XRE family transcriptional regulator
MLEYFQKGGAVVALTSIITMLFAWINLILVIGFGFLVVKFLISGIKYFSSKNNTQQKTVRHNLGDLLKDYRIKNNMTQEFVAEHLGVSRQAVSKWESGASDPSTANLLALAKLFGISAAELLKNVAE